MKRKNSIGSRVLSLLLTLVMVFSIVPPNAHAAGERDQTAEVTLGDFAAAETGKTALSASDKMLSQKTLIAVPYPGATLQIAVNSGYQVRIHSGDHNNSIDQVSDWMSGSEDGGLHSYTLPRASIYMRVSIQKEDGSAITLEELESAGVSVFYESSSDILADNAAAAQILQDSELPILVHLTDIHGDIIRAERAAAFADAVGADAILVSGDLTANQPDDWGSALLDAAGKYPDVDFIYGIGNHDAQGIPAASYRETVYNAYFKDDPRTAEGETYYYHDLADQKLRIIAVNQQEGAVTTASGGTCYSQEQVDWLVNSLKTTPAGYGVILMYHSPEVSIAKAGHPDYTEFFQVGNRYDNPTNNYSSYSGSFLMDLVDAFMLRRNFSWSYSEKGGASLVTLNADFTDLAEGVEFIAHVTGHVHSDSVTYLPGTACRQLLLGGTCTTAMYGADGGYYGLADYSDLDRQGDTASQDAFNAYMIDRESRSVRILRIGARQTISGGTREDMTIPYSALFTEGDYLFSTEGLVKIDLDSVQWVNHGIQAYGIEPTYLPGLRWSPDMIFDVPYEGVTFYIKINDPYEMGIRSGATDTTMNTNYYWLNNKTSASGGNNRGYAYTLPEGHSKFALSLANVTRCGSNVLTSNPVNSLEFEAAGLEIWYKPCEHTYSNGVCTLCGAEDPNTIKPLSLRYDDRYDVSGKTVEIIDAGAPTSYQVGYGVEENAVLDTAVVTLEGDTLIATGIGTAQVRIDGVLHEVTVEAAPISLLLLIGQSNMEGNEGDGDQSIVCPDGMVYATYGDRYDMTLANATHYAPSALTGAYRTVNAAGGCDGLSDYPVYMLTDEGDGRKGPDSGFAYEWVEQTGEKVWVVNAAHGGTSLDVWQPGTTQYEECQAMFTACTETLRKEIAAGHFTLSHMAYFWCQGCNDRSRTAKWYEEKYLSMHNALKEELAFDHDSDPATADRTFELGGIIPVRTGSSAACYRDGVNGDVNSYAYHESFVDLRMSGPRVAQYMMCNDPELEDIVLVCTAGEDWVWMPDGTNGVSEYFNKHYENGTVDYTTQVAQSESWYTPTTPKAVHDSIHYNQIGYNEVGRESVRNALIYMGINPDYEEDTAVRFVDWTGYKEVSEIAASDTGASGTLVVPMVTPITRSKDVTYTVTDGLEYKYYDLLAESGETTGSLTAKGAEGSVSVVKAQPGALYKEHLAEMPEVYCAGTNLWAELEHSSIYYYGGTHWGDHESGTVRGVTIPIREGNRIYATSFGKAGENGHTSSNGIRCTFFGDYDVVKTLSPAETYAEFSANGGYLIAPEGAVAVNIPMWVDSDDSELYILDLSHDSRDCVCGICGKADHSWSEWQNIAPPHSDGPGADQRICIACGETEEREVNGVWQNAELSAHLARLPDDFCCATNLWEILPHDDEYYYNGSYWGAHPTIEVYSLTLEAEPGERIFATSFSKAGENNNSSNGIRVTFFGGDGDVVKTLSPAETYAEFSANGGYLIAPKGTAAVNVPMYGEANNEFYLLDAEHTYANGLCTACGEEHPGASAWEGKTIACIGDSITCGVGVTKDETDYVTLLAEKLGMEYIRLGVSGTTLCSGGHRTCNIGKLTEANLAGADIVTILMGINDFNQAKEDYYMLGTIESTDPSTIYGAVRMWCERIEELRTAESLSHTEFCFITPTITNWRGYIGGNKSWDQSKVNLHGYTLRDLCNAIIEVAALYDIPVIDLNVTSGLYYISDEDNSINEFGGDGLHPGVEGHAMMAEAIANALLRRDTWDDHHHSYGSWIPTKYPSCQKGTEARVCSVCSAVETRETAESGVHHYVATAVTAPTCTEQGYTTYTCACGDSYADDYVEATGHSYVDGVCGKCTYSYPMGSVEKLEGTIAIYNNTYIVADGYHGAVIALENMDFNAVSVLRNPEATLMGYAFLRELPTVGEVPPYAGDYTEVIWDENAEAELDIPDDAAYLYIYYNSHDIVYLPSSVTFKNVEHTDDEGGGDNEDEELADRSSVTVASWNIGHFSGGGSSSKVTDAQFDKAAAAFSQYIYEELDADLMAVNEYSAMFTPSNRAEDALFSDFSSTHFEGTQYNYSCNALFSHLPVQDLQAHAFECNQNAVIGHTSAIKASDYYYLRGEIMLGDEAVTVIGAHLGFDLTKSPDTVCLNQIDELLAAVADCDRVILMGDWNVLDFAYFDRFADAGYTLGNTDSTKNTYAYDHPNRSLDNIMVKGLEIADFEIHSTTLSDHYAVSAVISLPEGSEEHTHAYTAAVTAPTCTQQGYTTYTCTCGESYVDDYTDPRPYRILLIGNSFSWDAADAGYGLQNSQMYDAISAMLKDECSAELGVVVRGSTKLSYHYSMIENAEDYKYTKYSSTGEGWTPSVPPADTCISEVLESETWDAVVIQPYREELSGGNNAEESMSNMLDYLAEHEAGAKVYYYMPWSATDQSDGDTLAKYEEIAAYTELTVEDFASEKGNAFAGIIPVGTGIQNARTTYLDDLHYAAESGADPNVDSQRGLERDKQHISFGIGRYIAGVIMAETLIPQDMRREEYSLPDIKDSAAIGPMPQEYNAIARLAAGYALEEPYAVTDISGYDTDPAEKAVAEIESAEYAFEGIEGEDELLAAVKTLVKSCLDAEDFAEPVIVISEYELSEDGSVGSLAAEVTLRYGYTTKTANIQTQSHTHSYTAAVTAPTCTEQGYTTYTCECGDSYVDDYVPAAGHSEVVIAAVKENSVRPGMTEGCRCDTCGEILEAQQEIPAKGYDWMLEDGEFKILLIGNSFSEDASSCGQGMTKSQFYNILQEMLGEDVKVTLGLLYSGGKGVHWFATQAEQGNKTPGFYVITPESDTWVRKGVSTTQAALSWTDWDVVTLQPYDVKFSTESESVPYPEQTDEKFYPLEAASEYMLDHIDAYAPQADVYCYMHWARSNSASLNVSLSTYRNFAEFYPKTLDYVGSKSGNRYASLIPVGLSIQNARTTYLALLSYNSEKGTTVNLQNDPQIGLQRDGGHVTFNVGRYIAGLTFAETLIPAELRTENYTLPDIRITESVGELPKEYTEIAQKSVFAAVEGWKNGSLEVTEIPGYETDPIETAEALDGTSVSVGCAADEEGLRELISAAILSKLPADFAVDSVILGEGSCTAVVRFGYSSREISLSFETAEHSYTATVTAPTCTDRGYTTYTCDCGDSYVSDYTDKLNLTVIPITSAEVEQGGYYFGQDSQITTRLRMADQIFVEAGTTVKYSANGLRLFFAIVSGPDADCYLDGGQWHTGSGGFEVDTDGYLSIIISKPNPNDEITVSDYASDIEIHMISDCAHNYEKTVVAPTATADGYTTHTCTKCGHRYITDYTEGKTFRILLIGNSFSQDATRQFRSAARAFLGEDVKIEVHLAINAAKTVAWHATQASQNNQAYKHRYIVGDSDNFVHEDDPLSTLEEIIQLKDWDVVTVQSFYPEVNSGTASGLEGEANQFLSMDASIPFMLDYIDRYAPQAKVYYYMAWQSTQDTSRLDASRAEFEHILAQTRILTEYSGTDSARTFDGVIPVGTAIQNARSTYLGLIDYSDDSETVIGLQRDSVHLAYAVGGYIAALTFAEYVIPENMRQSAYALPEIPKSTAVGALPEAYTEIAQNAVYAALKNPYSVTAIAGFETDPADAVKAQAALLTPDLSGVRNEAELTAALADAVQTLLGQQGFGEPAVTVHGSSFSDAGQLLGYHASVEIRFGYTTRTAELVKHAYVASVTPPTCTEQGYTTYNCECGDSYVDDYVEAAGHSMGRWSDNGDGTHSRSCSECTHSDTEAHGFGRWSDKGDGSHWRACTDCGLEEVGEHSWDSGYCESCGADAAYVTPEGELISIFVPGVEEGGKIMTALYDAHGKMLACFVAEASDDALRYSTAGYDGVAEVIVFVLDGSYVPIRTFDAL